MYNSRASSSSSRKEQTKSLSSLSSMAWEIEAWVMELRVCRALMTVTASPFSHNGKHLSNWSRNAWLSHSDVILLLLPPPARVGSLLSPCASPARPGCHLVTLRAGDGASTLLSAQSCKALAVQLRQSLGCACAVLKNVSRSTSSFQSRTAFGSLEIAAWRLARTQAPFGKIQESTNASKLQVAFKFRIP